MTTFGPFPDLDSKRLKISLLRALLGNFRAWAQKNQNKASEATLGSFPGLGSKRSLLRLLLGNFQAWAQTGLEKSQNKPSEATCGSTFGSFPGLGSKRHKISLLRLLLGNFQAWAPKVSKQAFWGYFWTISRPVPKKAQKPQNKPSEATFGAFAGLGSKRPQILDFREHFGHAVYST